MMSVLSVLGQSLLVCLIWNTLGFIPSAIMRTEKMFDAFGTSSFAITAVFAFLRGGGADGLSWRKAVAMFMICVWAGRLFVHLFVRVHLLHGDRRFDNIKNNSLKFAAVWMVQAVWGAVVGLPIYAVLMNPSDPAPFSLLDALAIPLWTTGFIIETLADVQKLSWQIKHGERRFKKFISHGLWSLSRHPNFFGEIVVWVGCWLFAVAAFERSSTHFYVLGLSPLFVTFLLTRVSGVTLLEKQARERFKGDAAYARYARETSLIVPWFPSKKSD